MFKQHCCISLVVSTVLSYDTTNVLTRLMWGQITRCCVCAVIWYMYIHQD